MLIYYFKHLFRQRNNYSEAPQFLKNYKIKIKIYLNKKNLKYFFKDHGGIGFLK